MVTDENNPILKCRKKLGTLELGDVRIVEAPSYLEYSPQLKSFSEGDEKGRYWGLKNLKYIVFVVLMAKYPDSSKAYKILIKCYNNIIYEMTRLSAIKRGCLLATPLLGSGRYIGFDRNMARLALEQAVGNLLLV